MRLFPEALSVRLLRCWRLRFIVAQTQPASPRKKPPKRATALMGWRAKPLHGGAAIEVSKSTNMENEVEVRFLRYTGAMVAVKLW